MKKGTIVILCLFAFIVVVALWMVFSFFGNPISKLLVRGKVNSYIETNYSNTDVKVDDITYDFKMGNYCAKIVSPTSKDTHFTIYASGTGGIVSDSYPEDVEGRYNTQRRICDEYFKIVKDAFDSKDFPYEVEIGYGEILFDKEFNAYGNLNYLDRTSLELDKDYNVKELAKEYGSIVLYIPTDKEITDENVANILLDVGNYLTEKDIPYYSITFTLEEPMEQFKKKAETTKGDVERDSIQLLNFKFKNIYESGMLERVIKSRNSTANYYEHLKDSKKQTKYDLEKDEDMNSSASILENYAGEEE